MTDDQQPEQEHPTEAVPEPPTEPVSPAVGAEQEQRGETANHGSGPRWAVALVLVLILGVGGGFLIGRATAPDEGPSSLAEAVSQTAKGDLPVGKLDLQELLQSIGKDKGGALGQIFGGRDSSGSDAVSGILGGLLDHLKDELEHGSSGESSNGTSSGAAAYLGVQAQAAPSGTTGVVIGAVAPDSPAADSGLQAGDVVTKVDDTAVATPAELASAVRAHSPGDAVTITYTRSGTSATAKVRLASMSSATSPTTAPPTTQAPTNA